MARIDALLAQMRSDFAARAVLQSDAATQLQSSSGVSQGQVLTAAELEALTAEILAPPERLQLENTGQTTVFYEGFQVSLHRANGILRLVITPAVATSAPPGESAPFMPTPHLINGLDENQPNNSGQGKESVPPAEIRGFNWGAFFLSWIWALGHGAWVRLLALIPVVGLVMNFVLGFKGNEWAWQNRRYASIADFKKAQKNWAMAGLVLVVGGCMMFPIPAAILFPVFARARENARKTVCQNNLKQISLGVMQWSADHGDKFPTANSNDSLRDTVMPYIKNSEVFECKSDTVEDGTSDYQYNPDLSGVNIGDLNDPSSTPMLWDKPSIDHLDGGNIAFADGHIKWFHKNEFDALTQSLAP